MRQLTILTLLYFTVASAQSDRTIAVKIYSQFNHTSGTEVQSSTLNIVRDSFTIYTFSKSRVSLSPAVQWGDMKAGSHEVAITQFGWDRIDDQANSTRGGSTIPMSGSKQNRYTIGLRYEYIRSLNFFKLESPFATYISMAASPILYVEGMNPVTSNSFPSTYSSLDLDVFVVPRLRYAVSDRCHLDLNVPLILGTLKYETFSVANPVLNSEQQKTTRYSQELLPAMYEVRLGIGVKIK